MKIEFILILPILIWAIVNFSVWRSVKLLSEPEKLLKEVEYINDNLFINEKKAFSDWCSENGYAFEKDFLFFGILNGPPIKCSAWWSKQDNTWALLYVTHMGNNTDYITAFENGISITTASSKDALTLPMPHNSHIQVFTNVSQNERYTYHKNVIENLTREYNFSIHTEKTYLFEQITDSILKQTTYIRQFPAWYLRGAYWFFVNRNFNLNKPIQI